MSYLRIRTLFAASFLLAVLVTFTGCSGDRRERVRDDRDRGSERSERRDDRQRVERHDSNQHEESNRQSGHDRGDRDGR
jgi:hypothetical protein